MRTRRGQWEPGYLQTEIFELIQKLFLVEYQDLPPNIAVCSRLKILISRNKKHVERRTYASGDARPLELFSIAFQ